VLPDSRVARAPALDYPLSASGPPVCLDVGHRGLEIPEIFPIQLRASTMSGKRSLSSLRVQSRAGAPRQAIATRLVD
jgi:hypothetical protein